MVAFVSVAAKVPALSAGTSSFVSSAQLSSKRKPVGPSFRYKRCAARATAAPISPPRTMQLVDELLRNIELTDRGLNVTTEKRQHIDSVIEELNEVGKSQSPMTDPRLFSNYTVAYTSTSDKSPPAGGLFRTVIGRTLFRTRGLFQHVIAPDVVVNLVCFRVLGILKGCVSLRGKIEPLKDDILGPNAIRVEFERPRLQFGNAVFQFGPRSQVRLATTYLDDRVRLAIGGRGSLFVFTKGGQSQTEMASEWKNVFDSKPLPKFLLPLLALGFLGFFCAGNWPIRIVAFTLTLALGWVLKRGGIAHNALGAIED